MADVIWPAASGGGSGSNASVGQNGQPIPTSATLVAGEDPSLNLQPLQVDASKNLLVAVGSSALPVGAATAANQTSQITQETATATSVASIDTKTPTLGQKTMANSQPVAIASDQSAIPVTISGPLGQQAAASSLSVAMANEDVQDLYVTGQSAQTATVNNILTVASGTAATDLLSYRSFAIQVVSTGTAGTFIFEGSNDNVNFQSVPVFNQITLTGTPIVAAITATASQFIYQGAAQYRYIRLRIVTTITGGSIQAFSKFSLDPFHPSVNQVAQATAANLNATISGTVTANQGTAAVIANSWFAKLSDATTGPVKVQPASTTPAATDIALTVALSPNGVSPKSAGRALSNAPTVTTYSTPVTSAAYVQIIASTTAATNLVEIFDSSGVALFFAVGGAGSEVNQFVIYPGGNGQVPLAIPAASRISYKAVSTSASGASLFNVLNLYT